MKILVPPTTDFVIPDELQELLDDFAMRIKQGKSVETCKIEIRSWFLGTITSLTQKDIKELIDFYCYDGYLDNIIEYDEDYVPMSEKYTIRLYDTDLITFKITKTETEGLIASDIICNNDLKNLFPFGIDISSHGIIKWLSSRIIPKNRAFADKVLASLGVSGDDPMSVIDISKGLSLNDSYWVVPESFSEPFSNYNLYENDFSDVLSLIAYTGYSPSGNALSSSPELTTNGNLRKCWRRIDKKIYLYKGGSFGAANAGYEPFSEYYASQIADAMGISAVKYDLTVWKNTLSSTCPLFTDINTSFVPFAKLNAGKSIYESLNYFKALGQKFFDKFCSMIVFDAVIYNEDRHFNNFGVMRDNKTGEIIDFAPLFDNGISLFNYATENDFLNIKQYAKTRTNPYSVSYLKLCDLCLGTVQKEQLNKLKNFTFTRHPSYNLPENRLCEIEKQIQYRIREIEIYTREKSSEGPAL